MTGRKTGKDVVVLRKFDATKDLLGFFWGIGLLPLFYVHPIAKSKMRPKYRSD